MGREVNQRELSEILGVSHQTMARWSAEGMPVRRRGVNGQENAYDTREVIDWMIRREVIASGKETQRDRLTRLQADALELDLAERNNALVPADQVGPAWRGWCFTAAAFLHGQRSRLAAELDATPGIEAKRALLGQVFAEFLTKLGTDGEQLQRDVEEFVEKLSTKDAADLLMRFTLKRHDDASDADPTAERGPGGARPGAEGGAVDMG